MDRDVRRLEWKRPVEAAREKCVGGKAQPRQGPPWVAVTGAPYDIVNKRPAEIGGLKVLAEHDLGDIVENEWAIEPRRVDEGPHRQQQSEKHPLESQLRNEIAAQRSADRHCRRGSPARENLTPLAS